MAGLGPGEGTGMFAVRPFGALMLATAITLSGCGITYVSPLVNQGDPSDNVQVLPMTRESVAIANRAPYVPRDLPAVFSQIAGGAGAGAATGSGLPPPPVFPTIAPGELELRPPPPATVGPYRIGVGDVVQLATRTPAVETTDLVTGDVAGDELRQRYTVRDDGAIALPEVGTVQIGGLTIDEAEQQLFQRLLEAGIDPNFSLEIAQFNSQVISVGGDVAEPANLPVTLNPPTLDQALTAVGGVTASTPEFASIRIYRDGTLYQIPLTTFNQDGDLRDIQLVPGDSIFVDSSYDLDRALEFYTQQIEIANLRRTERSAALTELGAEIGLRRAELTEARTLFESRLELGAEQRDYVYLAGEVGEQSRYPLPFEQQASLADALFEAEGFERGTGNPSQIYVLRAPSDLSQPVAAWHLDARNAANLTLATQFQLRPNDIIFIEEQPITRWNRAFQQFFPTVFSSVETAVGG